MRGCVQDLLIEMQNAEAHSLDYLALASVLVTGAKSSEDAIRLTALRWLASIIKAAKPQLLPLYASILQAILPALASTLPDILEVRILSPGHRTKIGPQQSPYIDLEEPQYFLVQSCHVLRPRGQMSLIPLQAFKGAQTQAV